MYNKPDISEIAKRIKATRKTKYKSQELFADALHVNRQTVQGWESGKTLPDLDNLVAISALLDVDLDYLTGRIDCVNHSKQFVCDWTGLSKTSLDFLIEISSGGSFYAQILDCINRLLEDAAKYPSQSVLIDIHNFMYVDNITLEDHRENPAGRSVSIRTVQDLNIYNDRTQTGTYLDHKKVIRETLQREIFDKLRAISKTGSKKRNH